MEVFEALGEAPCLVEEVTEVTLILAIGKGTTLLEKTEIASAILLRDNHTVVCRYDEEGKQRYWWLADHDYRDGSIIKFPMKFSSDYIHENLSWFKDQTVIEVMATQPTTGLDHANFHVTYTYEGNVKRSAGSEVSQLRFKSDPKAFDFDMEHAKPIVKTGGPFVRLRLYTPPFHTVQ